MAAASRHNATQRAARTSAVSASHGRLLAAGVYELRHVSQVSNASGWSSVPVCGLVRVDAQGSSTTETWILYSTYVAPTVEGGDGVALSLLPSSPDPDREAWIDTIRSRSVASGAWVVDWTYGDGDCDAVSSGTLPLPPTANYQLLPGTVEVVVLRPDGTQGSQVGSVVTVQTSGSTGQAYLTGSASDSAVSTIYVNDKTYAESWYVYTSAVAQAGDTALLLRPCEALAAVPNNTVKRRWGYRYRWLASYRAWSMSLPP